MEGGIVGFYRNATYEGTDSAAFVSNEASAYGYLITNQVGANGGIAGNGGNGNAWTVNGGSWISTWSGGNITMGQTEQSPRRAIMPAGTYEFEMSAQPLADGTTEFRWYILSDDGETYLHSGVHVDTVSQKTEFNGFVFSMQNGIETVTEIALYAVEVDRGAPIEIPDPIFSPFYVGDWGFLGGKFGAAAGDTAWSLTPGTLVGDAEVSGSAATGSGSGSGSAASGSGSAASGSGSAASGSGSIPILYTTGDGSTSNTFFDSSSGGLRRKQLSVPHWLNRSAPGNNWS